MEELQATVPPRRAPYVPPKLEACSTYVIITGDSTISVPIQLFTQSGND